MATALGMVIGAVYGIYCRRRNVPPDVFFMGLLLIAILMMPVCMIWVWLEK